MSDAAIVVEAKEKGGGTRSGACEQIGPNGLNYCPVFVRTYRGDSAGLQKLIREGAIPLAAPPVPAMITEIMAVEKPVPGKTAMSEWQQKRPGEGFSSVEAVKNANTENTHDLPTGVFKRSGSGWEIKVNAALPEGKEALVFTVRRDGGTAVKRVIPTGPAEKDARTGQMFTIGKIVWEKGQGKGGGRRGGDSGGRQKSAESSNLPRRFLMSMMSVLGRTIQPDLQGRFRSGDLQRRDGG